MASKMNIWSGVKGYCHGAPRSQRVASAMIPMVGQGWRVEGVGAKHLRIPEAPRVSGQTLSLSLNTCSPRSQPENPGSIKQIGFCLSLYSPILSSITLYYMGHFFGKSDYVFVTQPKKQEVKKKKASEYPRQHSVYLKSKYFFFKNSLGTQLSKPSDSTATYRVPQITGEQKQEARQ